MEPFQRGKYLKTASDDEYRLTRAREYPEGVDVRSADSTWTWRIGDDGNSAVVGDQSPNRATGTAKGQLAPFKHWQRGAGVMMRYMGFLFISLWMIPVSAVMIDFQNCLTESYQNNFPLQLQFVPLFLDAAFNTTDPSHNLRLTVYGNVTGSGPGTTILIPPPPSDIDYWNGNRTDRGGKISEVPDPSAPLLTTLRNKVNVLTYQPFNEAVNFCERLNNETCPLGPVFNGNESDPLTLHSFGLSNNFYSSYAFTSFTATLLIKNGDVGRTDIACISANITPDLGKGLSQILTFLPVIILIVVGFATAFAAVYSPWGTTDVFRWTSNYGRDADLLRLVTPGFGDCLQYIQFVALTGGLTLNYPGFYQPVASKASWSVLMFNESFVSTDPGYDSIIDGIYVTRGKFGLDIYRQLVGLAHVDDVWAGMAIWLLVVLAAVLALIQIGFVCRGIYRHVSKIQEEDLRAKNLPFSMGNVIRIVFNYFLLPIVALSMFQFVEATHSPAFTVGVAVVMLLLIVGFAVWLLFLIATTRPKSYLFDDLPTVLTYGSLYNTYSDDAAPFALVPVLLTFVRGVAIGGIQPSGTAQLVILAICEVITLLTLHAFRPFHSPTSMNAYHTFFAAFRFTSILLMISFTPSLGVSEGPKGWIGYVILLMHAVVLVFGFLLNAIQTIVEVAARLSGAGGDETGAARGGLAKVFGMRQLSRRLPRRDGGSRQSQLSNAAMLDSEMGRKSYAMDNGRTRSQSAGSIGILLHRQSTGIQSPSEDPFGPIPSHALGSGYSSYTPTTPGEASTFSFLPSAAAPSAMGRNKGAPLGLNTTEAADPYYRPPRIRRPTLEAYSPGARSRGSWASGDWAVNQRDSGARDPPEVGPSVSGRGTPVSILPIEGSSNETRQAKADYTTREVDFYYGVRGPALNANIPSRRIKTGPADPTGIPASAAGWFKGLFGGKTKEKGKGFEVVRSSRMPAGMVARNVPGQETPPEGIPVAMETARNGPIDSDDDVPARAGPSTTKASKGDAVALQEGEKLVSSAASDELVEYRDEVGEHELTRISDVPPTLPGIEVGGSRIDIPSRFPSKATTKSAHSQSGRAELTEFPIIPDMPSFIPSRGPSVPRKSSRRKSQSADMTYQQGKFSQGHRLQGSLNPSNMSRLPFERTNSKAPSTTSDKSSIPMEGSSDSQTPSGMGNFSAHLLDDRPTSMGFVNQHSIRTVNQSENPEFLGTAAEVVDGRNSGASSMENHRP